MRKILLFDMDGTLTDSMPVYSERILAVMKEDGAEIPEDIVRFTAPMTVEQILDTLLELGCKGSRMSLIARLDMRSAYANEVPLKPGVKEFLLKKKEEGCRLFVLTGSPHACSAPCLRHNGVLELFDHVYSTDDFGAPKNKPGIFTAVCQLQGISPAEVTFFDDNLLALRAAKEAGMEVIGVFDPSEAEDEEAIRAEADGFITGFTELLEK